jgi:hypothetical protein
MNGEPEKRLCLKGSKQGEQSKGMPKSTIYDTLCKIGERSVVDIP